MLVCFFFRCFCSPKLDSPSLKTTNAAFQWFRFRSSCILMNLPLLDIMFLTRNMHRAKIQHPIDRPENNPITSWGARDASFKTCDICRVHLQGIRIIIKCVKTLWWKSVMCHDCLGRCLTGRSLYRWRISSLGTFRVSLTDL